MDRAEIIRRLKATEPALRLQGVSALFLYGSYGRDEARTDSDIDVFVDKAPGRKFGLDEFMAAYRLLEGVLPGVEIGYTTREGLVEAFRPHIEKDAVRVF